VCGSPLKNLSRWGPPPQPKTGPAESLIPFSRKALPMNWGLRRRKKPLQRDIGNFDGGVWLGWQKVIDVALAPLKPGRGSASGRRTPPVRNLSSGKGRLTGPPYLLRTNIGYAEPCRILYGLVRAGLRPVFSRTFRPTD